MDGDYMKDKELQGNEKIEESIEQFHQARTEENLAVVLTAIRRQMQNHTQMVVPVEASVSGEMKVRVMALNGTKWLGVFTSFEEQMKGQDQVMSTFMADIGQILTMGIKEPGLEGVVINPWIGRLFLNKALLQVIMGK